MRRDMRSLVWLAGVVGYTALMLALAGTLVFAFTYGDCLGDETSCRASYAGHRETLL